MSKRGTLRERVMGKLDSPSNNVNSLNFFFHSPSNDVNSLIELYDSKTLRLMLLLPTSAKPSEDCVCGCFCVL